jgi:ribosomal protein S18 acetylase RimI-like enzyme
MWRMTVDSSRFTPACSALPPGFTVARLSEPDHVKDLIELFTDGTEYGEAPDAFQESMVSDGAFYGVRNEKGLLVSAAGTHVTCAALRVAAVGNVYTMRSFRRQRLAMHATSAVVSELLANDIQLIGLNVNQSNTPAIKTYEALGFQKHVPFYEGMAIRKTKV